MNCCCDNSAANTFLNCFPFLALHPVKLFAYILSIYLLALAVFPCCEVDDCPDDKQPTVLMADHENGDEDCGNCSPFFNCESCAAVSVIIETASAEMIPLVIKQAYTGYITCIIPQAQYDFWQPPKQG